MYGILRCLYGSVPRAVASALHTLAVLMQLAFPYTRANRSKGEWLYAWPSRNFP